MSTTHHHSNKAKAASGASKVQIPVASVVQLPDGSTYQEAPFVQPKKTIFGRGLGAVPKLQQATTSAFTNKVPTAHQFPTETKTMSNGTQYQAIILTSTCVHEGCQARPTDAFSTFGCPYIPIEDSESVAVDGAVSPRDAASPSGINTTSATTS